MTTYIDQHDRDKMVETKIGVIRRDSIREGRPPEIRVDSVAAEVGSSIASTSTSTIQRRSPTRRRCIRMIFLLQFQLAMAVLGVLFWVIPYGMDMAHDQMVSSGRVETILDPVYNRRRKNRLPLRPPAYQRAHYSSNQGLTHNYYPQGTNNRRRRRSRDFDRYPRVIFFVHIHKGAGTMFCNFADINQASLNKQTNCNVQQDQRCCGNRDSVDAQIEYAKSTIFDVVAIEREMYDAMVPDSFDYVVTLRDSQSRYFSHWKHLRRMMPIGPGVQTGGFGDSSWIFGTNAIRDVDIKKRNVPVGSDPLGNFAQWYEGQPDNWNTRILCGPRCRPQAKFQITESLFHYTLSRVEKFAHVLFVEDMEASYNKFAAHYHLRGYSDIVSSQKEKMRKHKTNRHNQTAKDQRNLHRSGENAEQATGTEVNSSRNETHVQILANTTALLREDWDPFMSALDDALYEFARRKYLNVTHEQLWSPFSNQLQLDRYFVEGPQMQCHDACCRRCTAY